MGLVQRDGINRLRHVMRYSRQKLTICTSLPEAGWIAGVGQSRGARSARDGEVRPDRGLGRQSRLHPGQRDDPHRARPEGARREAGGGRSVSHAGTAAVADMHLAPRPGTDGALACAVMHVAFRDGYADRAYHGAATPTARTRWRRIWRPAVPTGPPRSPACRSQQIEAFARALRHARSAATSASATASRAARNGAANMHAVTCLPTVTGAWQHEGGGALWSNRGIYHWDKTLIEGLDALDPDDPRCST